MIYTIISAIIIISALILIGILLIPFHISFYLQKREEKVKGIIQLHWMQIRFYKSDIPSKKKDKKEKEKTARVQKKERKFDVKKIFRILDLIWKAQDHLKPIFNAFIKSLALEKLRINLNVGFQSPVDTALISGYFWSMSSVLNLIPPLSLNLTPDFQHRRLDGSVECKIKLKLIWIMAAILKAVTKKPVRQLFWEMRALNK